MNEEKYREVRKLLLGYLNHLRKENNIPISYIVEFTGFNESTIERLLKGLFNPSLEQFIKLAEAMNCYFFVIEKEEDEKNELIQIMKNRWQQNKNQN